MNNKIIIASVMAGTLAMAGVVGLAVAGTAYKEAKLSEAQAIEIALREVPGEIKEVELENEFTKLVYEVEILTEEGILKEVEIHADSGEVLEVEIEDDEDDDYKDDAKIENSN